MEQEYYAHVRDNATSESEWQTVEEHLNGTAELCEKFAEEFGAGIYGKIMGITHDIGKYTPEFQNRLLHNGPKVDHATAGAMLCRNWNMMPLAACVIGHHSGLPDFGNPSDPIGAPTLFGRLRKGEKERYLDRCRMKTMPDPGALIPRPNFAGSLQASYWVRMLYSCLVDADYLDTELYMNGDTGRGGYDEIPVLLKRFEEYRKKFENPTTELNCRRNEIMAQCIQAGKENPRGVYTLTVPTGGGKTLASLAFALHHAATHGMKRVIYVIPYTSIIEQNAEVFRNILGNGNVLEHHAGVQFELSDGASPEEIRKALATENWDMPVVVTTTVQLFNSLYANRSSHCRKLHHLANSVIIFDEAQLIPLEHLKPCVTAISSLVEQFQATVVLCTATQPRFEEMLEGFAPVEICPQTLDLYNQFRRVTFQRVGKITDETLADRLSGQTQVLCVVNSRKAAQEIYSKLPVEGRYHLSTWMVAAQRQAVLEEIRKRLNDGKICRVVSTSLIEAGVDVDFPAVYRELAGLDSVLQAAGRCNREGKNPAEESIVTIFERTESSPKQFEKLINASIEALGKDRDPAMPETMDRYFTAVYDTAGGMDKYQVIDAFQRGIQGCSYPFATVAERFRLIDENTRTIYIPWGDGTELLEKLKRGEISRGLYRRLGRYTVSVYEEQYKTLYNNGALLTAQDIPYLDSESAILNDVSLYDETMGLQCQLKSGEALFFS